jgi:hypothetical protein
LTTSALTAVLRPMASRSRFRAVQPTAKLNKGAFFAGGAARPSLENAPCSTYPLKLSTTTTPAKTAPASANVAETLPVFASTTTSFSG